MNVKPVGLVNEWCLDFAGWHYRVELDDRGQPWTIGDGAVLCLLWPRDHSPPVPARSAYLLPSMLEAAK